MMYLYEGYHFWGMHLFWWIVWFAFIFWIFGTPYYVPRQVRKKQTPFEILRNRFVLGELTTEEYLEKKKVLENNY